MDIPRHIIRVVDIDKTIVDDGGIKQRGPNHEKGSEKKEKAPVRPGSGA